VVKKVQQSMDNDLRGYVNIPAGGDVGNLQSRVGIVESSLAEKAQLVDLQNRGLNVKFPPSPLVALKGDGTEEGSNFLALKTYAETNNIPLIIPFGTYKITQNIVIDMSKTTLIGVGMPTLDFSSLTSGYAIQLMSTADYSNTRKNNKEFCGLIVKGGGQSSVIQAYGLLIGHATNTNNALFDIHHISIEGFKRNIEFTHNSWRIKLNHIYSRWSSEYNVFADSGLTNMGENMVIANSMFGDGTGGISLCTGEWQINNTSIDNITLTVGKVGGGATQVYMHGGHFENPGATTVNRRYAVVNKGFLMMIGTHIILNGGGGNYLSALFETNDTEQGLFMDGVQIFSSSFYTPEVNDLNRVLVTGTGQLSTARLTTWLNGSYMGISKLNNDIVNGDAENGNTTGWTVTGTGTMSVDATTFKNGTKSFKLEGLSGADVYCSQKIKAKSGQLITGVLWVKTSVTDGVFAKQLNFLDNLGNTISTLNFGSTNTTKDWFITGIQGRCPAGTDSAQLLLQCSSSGTGNNTSWVDDIIINVI
jgi:hypothetical protein